MSVGITVTTTIGLGDAVQFTSIPENYFRHTGEKIVDTQSHWVFDFNPYVERNVDKVDKEINLWNAQSFDIPTNHNDRTVMLSNAEAHSRHFNYPIVLNRPRLYRFEDYLYFDRDLIILHTRGRSHGQLPEHIVKHVLKKYGMANVKWLAAPGEEWSYGFVVPEKVQYKNLWEMVEKISQCAMFIGPDSGPSWVAQCYPDVITKKVRLIPSVEALKNWVPLEWCRLGSYWDDRSAFIYNPSEDDAGFTWSYKRI